MKVLVATSDTQGLRPDDFAFCIDGELITVGVICENDKGDPAAGVCGCGRSFSGLNSRRATTTATVKDLELSQQEYAEALRSSLVQEGWEATEVDELATWLVELVSELPEGAVLERRGDDIFVRSTSPLSAVIRESSAEFRALRPVFLRDIPTQEMPHAASSH